MIEIETMPAKSGDSFLLHFDNGMNILIDMGYGITYKEYIRERLLELKKRGECIDLLIITHIDEDHIGGAVEFFKENESAIAPRIIKVKEIWYNACHHMISSEERIAEKLNDRQVRKIKDIIISKTKKAVIDNRSVEEISKRQGDLLAGYLYKYGYKSIWNKSFEGKAISIDLKNKINFNGTKILLLSPNNSKLKILYDDWKQYLVSRGIGFTINNDREFDMAYEAYIGNLVTPDRVVKEVAKCNKSFKSILKNLPDDNKVDRSKTNGASIAFIIEYKNKKLLFLADAHEKIILDGLEKYDVENEKYIFDLVKVSHHGSYKNNLKLLEKISSEKYLFSSDGLKRDHPSLEVIAKIIKSNSFHKKLYFNYEIKKIKEEISNSKLEDQYNYEVFLESKKIIVGE